jgi:hypothetical protein
VLDQQFQLPGVLAVREDADVAAVRDRHAAGPRGGEGRALGRERRIVGGEATVAPDRGVGGQGRDVGDAALGHQREDLRRPAVAVFDARDAGQRRAAHRLGGVRVRGDRATRVGRDLHDQRQLVLREGRSREAAWPVPQVGVDLDPIGAARDLAAHDPGDRFRPVDLLGTLHDGALRDEPARGVGAGSDDRAGDHDHPRPDDRALLERAPQPDIGLTGALGPQVAHGGEAGGQRPSERRDRARDAQRLVVAQHLIVPRALVVGAQQEMGVQVDQSGQQRRAAQIDPPRAVGCGEAGAGRDDPLAVDQDRPARPTGLAVEHRVGAEQQRWHRASASQPQVPSPARRNPGLPCPMPNSSPSIVPASA